MPYATFTKRKTLPDLSFSVPQSTFGLHGSDLDWFVNESNSLKREVNSLWFEWTCATRLAIIGVDVTGLFLTGIGDSEIEQCHINIICKNTVSACLLWNNIHNRCTRGYVDWMKLKTNCAFSCKNNWLIKRMTGNNFPSTISQSKAILPNEYHHVTSWKGLFMYFSQLTRKYPKYPTVEILRNIPLLWGYSLLEKESIKTYVYCQLPVYH